MKKPRILAVYREPIFSHNAVDADRQILEESVNRLQRLTGAASFDFDLIEAEFLLRTPVDATNTILILSMAQGPEALSKLEALEKQGITVLNSVASVKACYREAMSAVLSKLPITGHPSSQLADTTTYQGPVPYTCQDGYWLKRGDYHATTSSDVFFVRDREEIIPSLAAFAKRGIPKVVIQANIPGNIYKFYWVKDRFFTSKLVNSSVPEVIPVEASSIAEAASHAAAALGLEVCGGDCIVDREGGLHVIDMNDWPSFRTCRADAAEAIAGHSLTRIEEIMSAREIQAQNKVVRVRPHGI